MVGGRRTPTRAAWRCPASQCRDACISSRSCVGIGPTRSGTIRAVTRNDANHENHLAVLSALSHVATDPGQLVALLAAAEDDDAAVRLLREAYDFTPVQAHAVLDGQFRLLTRARRDAVNAALRDLRDALAAPWDPPLDVEATVRPPGGCRPCHRGRSAPRQGVKTWTTASSASRPWVRSAPDHSDAGSP